MKSNKGLKIFFTIGSVFDNNSIIFSLINHYNFMLKTSTPDFFSSATNPNKQDLENIKSTLCNFHNHDLFKELCLKIPEETLLANLRRELVNFSSEIRPFISSIKVFDHLNQMDKVLDTQLQASFISINDQWWSETCANRLKGMFITFNFFLRHFVIKRAVFYCSKLR